MAPPVVVNPVSHAPCRPPHALATGGDNKTTSPPGGAFSASSFLIHNSNRGGGGGGGGSWFRRTKTTSVFEGQAKHVQNNHAPSSKLISKRNASINTTYRRAPAPAPAPLTYSYVAETKTKTNATDESSHDASAVRPSTTYSSVVICALTATLTATLAYYASKPAHVVALCAATATLICAVVQNQIRYQAKLVPHTEVADEDSRFARAQLLDESVDVHYKQVDGTTNSTKGAVALFLHGFGSNTSSFEVNDAMRKFVQESSTSHPIAAAAAYDRPGFGLTERPTRLENFTDSQAAVCGLAVLRDVCEQLGDDDKSQRPVILVGHSAGAAVAAILAEMLGVERCQAIVLLAPSILPSSSKSTTATTRSPAALRVVARLFLAVFVRLLYPLQLFLQRLVANQAFWKTGLQGSWVRPIDPALVTGYSRPSMITGWDVGLVRYLLARLLEIGRRSSTSLLSACGCPILILHGQQDMLVPVSNSASLQKFLSAASREQTVQFESLENVGHSPQEEVADVFAARSAAFLREQLA